MLLIVIPWGSVTPYRASGVGRAVFNNSTWKKDLIVRGGEGACSCQKNHYDSDN